MITLEKTMSNNPLYDIMSSNKLHEFYFASDGDQYAYDDYWSGIVEGIDADKMNEAVEYYFDDIESDVVNGEFILGKHDVEFRPSI
jgi:hypothetical protein